MASSDIPSSHSSIGRVQLEVAGDLAFPPVTIREETFLVVIELLARFGRELEIRPEHDRIDRTGFLAKAAIDALHHVDVVTRGTTAPIFPWLRLDGDADRRANRFAEF